MTKRAIYPFIFLAGLMTACTSDGPLPMGADDNRGADGNGEFYIMVGLPDEGSRLSYEYNTYYNETSDGNIAARWEKGDVIKIYECDSSGTPNTDVYPEYEAYADAFPFPMAPVNDRYYRFECVGGIGTAHGIFRYVGLTTATVVAGTGEDADSYNVNLDIIPGHVIRNWENFDGLVIYGNPLRNYMMRHQESDGSMAHLKYGQRMKGHICATNFKQWYEDPALVNTGIGASTLLLYNTAGLVIRVRMGGFQDVIYGGATLSIDIPGVTSGYPSKTDVRNNPLSLTLGNRWDHQELLPPWAQANPSKADAHTDANTITAYLVGWPGTLAAGKEVTVTLNDNFYGKKYVWTLSKPSDFTFEEGKYYTFDLTDDPYVVSSIE